MEPPEQDRPKASLRLGFEFGRAAALPPRPPFRLLVIGDFGGSGAALSLRGEVPANLPEQLGVELEIEIANLLGSAPRRLGFRLPIRRFGDFSAKALLAAIEPLRRAGALRARIAAGSTDPEGFDDLDALLAALGTAPPPAPLPSGQSDADLLLSILGDAAPAEKSSGLGSVIGAITQPARRRLPVKEAVAAIDRIIAAQLAEIRAEPRFAAVEAAWRGLQLLLRRPPYGEEIEIDLLDVPAGSASACLLRDIVPDELEQESRPGLGAVLVLGTATTLVDSVERLVYCAVAGAALQVPVIASLPQGCFAAETAEDKAAWELLRGQEGAEWLAACHGDLLLEAEEREPPLWGEPGWAVAALALASVTRTGWPGELADASATTLEGLELHEIAGRGVPAAWPLRAPIGSAGVAALQQRGVATLGAQANRDRVFLAAAPTVGDETGLGDRLLIAALRAQLRGLGSAEAIQAVLGALLPDAADLTLEARPEGGFAITLRPGLRGLGGRRIAFDHPG
jgi:hypothetical protein